MKSFWVLLSALCLAACQTALPQSTPVSSNDPIPLAYMSGLNAPAHHEVRSAIVDRSFHLYVRLPENYDPAIKYPTVYLLDGGLTFPIMSGYYRYLSLGEELPDLIIVGVAYPGPDFENGNFRSTDYTAPTEEREFWGGATNFQSIFEHEIIPVIEKNYSSDNSRRVVWGQSLGGQFALYSALTRPDLFWGHIASNPALHRNLELFQVLEMDPSVNTDAKLYVASGENDDPVFRKPAISWINKWRDRTDLPIDLKTQSIPNHTHFSLAPISFREGLRWIFENE